MQIDKFFRNVSTTVHFDVHKCTFRIFNCTKCNQLHALGNSLCKRIALKMLNLKNRAEFLAPCHGEGDAGSGGCEGSPVPLDSREARVPPLPLLPPVAGVTLRSTFAVAAAFAPLARVARRADGTRTT